MNSQSLWKHALGRTFTSRDAQPQNYLVTCGPGLETLLLAEVQRLILPEELDEAQLSVLEASEGGGGVEVAGISAESMWRVALYASIAEGVRLRLGSPFTASNMSSLHRGVMALPWGAVINLRQSLPPLIVKASSTRSSLIHTGRVEKAVEEALRQHWENAQTRLARDDRTHISAEPQSFPAQIYARIVADSVQVSVCAVGGRLHQRGYRVQPTAAPLRETLAAACLRAVFPHPADSATSTALWDPFSGSGTLPLEFLLESHLPPLPRRPFAFELWPRMRTLASAFRSFLTHRRTLPPLSLRAWPRVFASDRSAEAIESVRANLRALLLPSQTLQTRMGDFERVHAQVAHQVGYSLLANLPYGRRSSFDARADQSEAAALDSAQKLYARIGRLVEIRRDLPTAAVLVPDSHVHTFISAASNVSARSHSPAWRPALRFRNGGIPTTLLKLHR